MKKALSLVFVLVIILLCSPTYGETIGEKSQQSLRFDERIAKLQHRLALLNADQKTANSDTAIPSAEVFVNIILIDERGNVPDCFKGIRVADITQSGKSTRFLFNGKPIVWNNKVVFGYSYTNNQEMLTGTIYYPTKAGNKAGQIANAVPWNVYQDDQDGTIRYEDINGSFPLAPKGSGYVILPAPVGLCK